MCFAPHLLHRTMDARLRLALCSPNITTYESEFVASSLYSGQHRSLNNVGNSRFVNDNVRALPAAMQVNLRRYSCIHKFVMNIVFKVLFFFSNPWCASYRSWQTFSTRSSRVCTTLVSTHHASFSPSATTAPMLWRGR